MDKVIDIQKLGMTFKDTGKRLGAENISLCQGDFAILTGDNGSGKSSLFHLLTMGVGEAYYIPDAISKIYLGFVPALQGKNILELTKNERELLRTNIAFVEQEDQFTYGIKAYEHLLHRAGYYIDEGYAGDKKTAYARLETLAERYIADYLQFTSIREMKRRKATAYSVGQKKIMNVLSAFLKCEAFGINIIFLDEPLNNLDVKNKILLRDIISDIRGKNPSLVILMISHCRIFPDVNKELKIRAGRLVAKDNPAVYDCLNTGR